MLNNSELPERVHNCRILFLHGMGVILISTAVMLLFWAILPESHRQNESTDYLNYYEPVARNLLRGVGLIRPDGLPAVSNPPGYPILLAGVFALAQFTRLPEDLVHSVFVLSCMSFSALFIFLISRGIWSLRGAWLSAVFFIIYPFALWLTKQPGTEAPFMLAFYASLLLFWNGLRDGKRAAHFLFLSGTVMGIAMLIRGIALGSGLMLFILFLVIRRNIRLQRRFLLAGMILLGNLVAVLPWQVWTYQQTGYVVLLGTNGVPSIRDGLTFAVNTKEYRLSFSLSKDVLSLQTRFLEESGSMDSVGEIGRHFYAHFLQEPRTVTKLIFVKAIRSWYGTDSGNLETSIAIIQAIYACIILTASVFLWRFRAEHRYLLLIVWAFVLYFWGMTTLVLSILRYMVPVASLFALIVPAFLHEPQPAPLRSHSS